jgi:hypothetical protein
VDEGQGACANSDKRKFDTILILTSWLPWKQMNARVFNNPREQYNELLLMERIKEELCL